ncbi:SRP19 protein [Dictyocaulus viviparus]|uniref:SRP19 protein n=1 Tax=Dictyocaulus viviparus TaxID=29172 RepID=A0A0D8XF48_DICVI|nr:SRP19 protein [Dictyocaulus viviparus]
MVDVKSKAFSDDKRWVVIYPTYIDSKKSLQQGRKIPKGLASLLWRLAVENPTSTEIHDVLAAVGLNPLLEVQFFCVIKRGKLHPREQDREPEKLGRVRVMLKNDDGTLNNKDFPNRVALYKYVASMIPKLKTRQPGFLAAAAAASSATKKNKKKK